MNLLGWELSLRKKQIKSINPQSVFVNGYLPAYGTGNATENIEKGYLGSADAYAIIRRIARTAAMVPFAVYKVKDEVALKDYDFQSKQRNYSTQGLLRKQLIKTKALEIVPNHPLQDLLDNPNPVYTKAEFNEGIYTSRLAAGNSYIYLPSLEFGVNAGKVAQMWLMPTQYMLPIITHTFPKYITGYQMNMFGIQNFTPEEVLHLRYFNPDFTMMGNELIGLSPLRAGSKILTRQQAETDYSVSAFKNSGARGIVTREDYEDSTDPNLGKMKQDYYTETTGTLNAQKLFFTAGKWTYQEIGLSPVDMNLLESEIKTFKKLCNLYGISDILFNNGEASTESNVKEMIKQLYTNAALPEVYAFRDALNASVTPLFNDKSKYYIDCDITGINELQDDMKEMADIFNALPIMIPNIILDAFGYGKQTDPLMDKVYVKSGYTDLENLNAIPDIPQVTPNGN